MFAAAGELSEKGSRRQSEFAVEDQIVGKPGTDSESWPPSLVSIIYISG